jgi:hypothetical protein
MNNVNMAAKIVKWLELDYSLVNYLVKNKKKTEIILGLV